MFQAFKAVLAHPEFQQALEEVQGLPEDQRPSAVSTQLTTEALAARGVPIAPGMGITTPDFGNIGGAGLTDGSPRPFQVCIRLGGIRFCVDFPVFNIPD